MDWIIIIAITILFAGLGTVAALAIRDEVRRFRAIQEEEEKKKDRQEIAQYANSFIASRGKGNEQRF